MALTATTLSKAKTLNGGFWNDTSLTLTSATGATRDMIAMVDNEFVRITDVQRTPTLGIVPGYYKTTAGPHAVGAPVAYGVPSDFVNIGGVQSQSFFTGAITGPNGAGTVPVVDEIIFLTASGAGAYTLALPAIDQTNYLTILNATAQAHVLTMTGNPATQDTATFVAALGGMLRIRANFGVWAVTGVQGVVVA